MLLHRILSITALSGLLAMTGCTGNGENPGNEGGGGTGGGNDGGDGGTSDTTPTTDTTDTGVATGTLCPAHPPDPGAACEGDTQCTFESYIGSCGSTSELTVKASCVDGEWQLLEPATCEPLPESTACDPFGTWLVEPGPVEGSYDYFDPHVAPFEVTLVLGDDGFAYVQDHDLYNKLSMDGCALQAIRIVEYHCSEEDGDVYCLSIWRAVDIDFSKTPVEGTVSFELESEVNDKATTTAVITKKE